MRHPTHFRFARLFVMAILAFGLSSVLASQQSPQQSKQLFDLLNQARKENKLPALRWNEQLATAAQRHADLMAEHGELAHDFPGERSLPERVADATVRFSKVAENVGLGPSPEVIHDLLMHSPGHRANILDPGFNEVGIAVVRRASQLFAVQDFAYTVPDLDARQQTALVAALLKNEGYIVTSTERNAAMFCENDNDPAMPGVTKILRFETSDLNTLPDGLKDKELKKSFRNVAVASCKADPSAESAKGFTRYRMVVLLY